jgi:hypothetical protein
MKKADAAISAMMSVLASARVICSHHVSDRIFRGFLCDGAAGNATTFSTGAVLHKRRRSVGTTLGSSDGYPGESGREILKPSVSANPDDMRHCLASYSSGAFINDREEHKINSSNGRRQGSFVYKSA